LKETSLMKQVLETYNMTYGEFSNFSGIPLGTLEGYNRKPSNIGEILLNKFLEVKKLEEEIKTLENIKAEEPSLLEEKSKDLDKLVEIINKYKK
jgi:predicted transcriptional regulator